MSRIPDATYEEYAIFTFVVPNNDGRWLATSEVEKPAPDGMETFQQFGGPCYGNNEDEARERVLADTRQKIDDIHARPV